MRKTSIVTAAEKMQDDEGMGMKFPDDLPSRGFLSLQSLSRESAMSRKTQSKLNPSHDRVGSQVRDASAPYFQAFGIKIKLSVRLWLVYGHHNKSSARSRVGLGFPKLCQHLPITVRF